ncbi:MAG: hypothetical protein ACRDD7_08990 [Peptostreptococcaceae bacterium]
MINFKLVIVLIVILVFVATTSEGKENDLILGGRYIKNIDTKEVEVNIENNNSSNDLERFFRPSNSPILNDKVEQSLYNMSDNKVSDIKIPDSFIMTPEDVIVNYYSVLREAANPMDDTKTGCGSLGGGKGLYSVAYNFLDDKYKKNYSYEDYLKSFENILHINLIKINKIDTIEKNHNKLKYFVELETIQGSKEKLGLFAYYYGYINLEKTNDTYKITNMEYEGENYLCAPYHGWRYDAESFVSIEYGDWCSLVDGKIDIKQNGYEKKAYFKDKDKNEYYVLFYQLTNGVDLKIGDYKKNKRGKWERIDINPEKCLDKNKK